MAQSVAAPPGKSAPASDDPPMLLDEMNGARPVLELFDPTPGVGILRQAIDQGGEHFGEAEHLTLAIPPGTSANLAYGIRKAPVIEELKLEAWVWCSRPGIQLGAVLVLPRSLDPATGEPRRLILRSGVTAEAGNWQRIVLEGVPTLRDRQVRVARATYGPDLAEAESFLSHIVIIAPGGSGATDVWVDKISLYGVVEPRNGSTPNVEPALAELAATWSATSRGVTPVSAVHTPRREPPPMPRIIQWQGEPLETLAQLGFDAVGMGRLPGAAELAEAERLGLWLVCPPPSIEALESRGVSAEYDGVLAWDLGELDDAAEIELAAEWSRALERHERLPTRPTLVRSATHPREASRVADIVLLGRPTVGATATWLEQAAWLGHARQLGRPGTIVWAGLDTQRSPATLSQLSVLRDQRVGSGAASYGHLARATTAALGARPRGFWFKSHSSLAGTDAETRRRALGLELANLRLGMIEPWLAGGKAATPAKSSRDDLTAMVLTVERSHLVIPMRWSNKSGEPAPGSVFVGAARPASQEVSFVLPGVPEACDAYLLTIAGPKQLSTRRVTGGLSVTAERLPDDAFLLLTEDTFALSHVERYLRRFAPRAAQARVELAELQREEAVAAVRLLPSGLLQSADPANALARVDAALVATRRTLSSQDYAAAFARAELVDGALANLRERLFVTMWPDGQAGASPVRGDWESLPDLERVARITASAAPAPAVLAGGDFESLAQVLEAGWRRSDDRQHGVAGAVRLSADNPQTGAYCLELEALLTGDADVAPVLSTPPVWITSPPLAVPPGHVVEISGWARISETPLGSADPLLVFDSVGGEESAIRISSTTSWERFRLVRACPPGTECRLTVALGGVGRASIDAVQYRFLPLPVAGPIALR
jgi:hypothetical protein